ncbi:alkylation response protein AidB-like acyl-CoA dehydrogenase [Alteromonadaceae bacterium 2753L.S.0a.02]|nr:alkylation response protein AidB-like acyl-CoA dehydrogenase [Alteromonadaceae bacterium 2753L.S.0a.02]
MLATRLEPLLKQIRSNAPKAEAQQSVPTENVSLLQEIGFFKALLPKSFGGLELDIPEFAEAIIVLATACPSTAWACALLANHSHGVALFSEKLQNEIWGENADTLISSSVAPLGQWQPAEGGIRLSGRFGWSSGCDHAQWAVLGYMGTNPMGQPGPCFAVVPRSDYEILDDWDSAALRGTGSKSLLVEDVFVPEYRTESLFALNFGLGTGQGIHPGALYFMPFSPVFSLGFSCVALGIAKRTLELYRDKTGNRVRAYTGAKVGESAPAYMRLAESTLQVDAAHELLRSDWREMKAAYSERALPPSQSVLDWRAHQSYAIKLAIEAVDRLFSASGGSAWMNSNELQRMFRDVHICGSHAQTEFDMTAATYGRHLMGLAMDAKGY